MNRLPLVKALHVLLGVLLCAAPLPVRAAGALLREEGAIYLEDLLPRPVKLATVQDAPIFWKIDLGKYLGTLRKGQLVEIQAVSDEGLIHGISRWETRDVTTCAVPRGG